MGRIGAPFAARTAAADRLRFAPDVAARFGIYPEAAAKLAADERALEDGVAAESEADVDEGASELTQAA